MKTYFFHTHAEMKPYNYKKWFICSDIVSDMRIAAESLNDAINKYCDRLEEQYISVSKNARKKKQPIYRDTDNGAIQTGFCFTAKTGFEDRSTNTPYTEQYIELWTDINILNSAF